MVALLSLSRLLVTNDSGPAHLASLTSVRSVVLFGPETPRLYGPVNERNTAVTAGLACSPCIHAWNARVSTCRDNQCMKRISANEAADAACGPRRP